ncbi:MAG: hypothetical protein ACLUD1_06560 [Clostridia bacterium]
MDLITILIIAVSFVLIVMLILLICLAIVYFKSKGKKEEKKTASQEVQKIKKNYAAYESASVLDFMDFDKIEDNMIIQKNGTRFVMVVECQGVNYDLMSEAEKIGVEEGFVQFLNTLRHPVQLYMQTRTINLEDSIHNYKSRVDEVERELQKRKNRYEQMKKSGAYSQEQLDKEFFEITKQQNLYEYGKDVVFNTERMSLNKNVLSKKYYIVIPYVPEEIGNESFDKEEIKNMAFSELYTRAQSIVRTIAACGVNGSIMDSYELADLLYVAYNRDEAEVYGLNRALKAGYDELYSTAPDVMEKKMKELRERIEKEAYDRANQEIERAQTELEKEYSNIQKKRNGLSNRRKSQKIN